MDGGLLTILVIFTSIGWGLIVNGISNFLGMSQADGLMIGTGVNLVSTSLLLVVYDWAQPKEE